MRVRMIDAISGTSSHANLRDIFILNTRADISRTTQKWLNIWQTLRKMAATLERL